METNTMTAISDFVNNPSTFLRNNIVRARFQLPDNPSHMRMFKFDLKPYQATKLLDGSQIPVYEIVPMLGQEERIYSRNATSANRDYVMAYWCPYSPGEMHAIVVDNQANFMFTTNMDGCSFGIGSATPTGARRVAHINLWGVTANSRVAQNVTLQVSQLDEHLVNPQRYMKSSLVPTALNGEIKITSFGIRDVGTGNWRFIYQQYRILNNNENNVVLVNVKAV
jgi:hypothetical protein